MGITDDLIKETQEKWEAEKLAAGLKPEQFEMEAGLNSEGLTLTCPHIVKVQYYSETTGELSAREYTYYSADRLSVGDIVIVPVRDTTGKAKVSAIDVPESEISAFKDKVKTIPTGAAVQAFAESNDNAPYLSDIDNYPELERLEAEASTFLNEPDTETAITLRPGEDVEVRDHYATALKLLEYAKSMSINTLEDSKMAVSDLATIGTCKRAMEAKRKEYLEPHQNTVKDIQAVYKELMAPVLEAEEVLKSKQIVFLNEQKRIQVEQERINQQRYEAAQAEMALKGELTEPVNLVEVIEAPKLVRGVAGTSGMVDHWGYEIIDRDLIPREYMIEDTVLLNNTAKKYHDTKPVAGIKFVNKPYLATRR